jgi:xanthine/uracil permease
MASAGVVMPEERLSWPRTVGIGLQHVVAMFGATVLVPLLTGFPPATTILFSGVGTLVFLVVVRNRVPSYLGSSFAFIAVVIAASGYGGTGPNLNLGVALMKAGQLNGAAREFEATLRLDPQNKFAPDYLSQAQAMTNRAP